MSSLRSALGRGFLGFAALGFPLLASSCATTGHLSEYDFRDRSLAVVTTLPPQPVVVILEDEPEEEGEGRRWWQAILFWGSQAVQDAQAQRAGEKLAKASETVDISGLMADGVLELAARLLRARPVSSVQGADFEIEVRVKEYGITAGTWGARADFFVRGEVRILDGPSGKRIWKEDVDASDPIHSGMWVFEGTLGNLVTAKQLGDLTVKQMESALAGLAEFAAVTVAGKLEAGLEAAGGR